MATEICCSENLMADEIRYDVTYKCNGLQNEIQPDRQTTLCRWYKKLGSASKLDHGKIVINIAATVLPIVSLPGGDVTPSSAGPA